MKGLRYLLIALLTTHAVCLHAAAVFKKTNTTIEASFGFKGDYVDDKQVEARIFGAQGEVKFDQLLFEKLKARIGVGVTLETGSNNSLFVDEFAPDQRLYLIEGNLVYTPFNWLELKAGAINQGMFSSPLLLTSTNFLAATEKVSFQFFENYQLYLHLQQGIPQNDQLSVRVGAVEEGTPSFFMESIGLDLPGDLVSLNISAGQFAFNKLSNSVAYHSRFLGNSVTGLGQDDSSFLYKFQGLNFQGRLEFRPDYYGFMLSGQYLYNDKAPDNRNNGHLARAGIVLGDSEIFTEVFRNESDTSPAFYNSKTYGHNNRKGMGIGSRIAFRDFLLRLHYSENDIIEGNIFQSDSKVFQFWIKKDLL